MTGQLKAQQMALLGANLQLNERRLFTEAVLTGVSAGVLSIDAAGIVRTANRSAAALLEVPAETMSGQSLSMLVPELAAWLDAARETGQGAIQGSGQVKIARGAETQTLSVRIAADGVASSGVVLTFDDISAQLADQRRAAWADVARRIAHEIKNPLTPIQLAAERLERKFGRQIDEDRETFSALTGMIVRQVGDLHRMVNEFSDFARLPRPVFALESIALVVRDAVMLQQVAFPTITLSVEAAPAEPIMADRQQVARLFTNLLKNAGEAVTARMERDEAAGIDGPAGRIAVLVEDTATEVTIAVTDNGVGLPVERRDQLTEPYVTTRARGTGLGLAIVKKIIEDHGGSLELNDAPGGGAAVRVRLPRAVAEAGVTVRAAAE
jgi:two-component system nitrogen regulation sensor histidine kinase NtrY